MAMGETLLRLFGTEEKIEEVMKVLEYAYRLPINERVKELNKWKIKWQKETKRVAVNKARQIVSQKN